MKEVSTDSNVIPFNSDATFQDELSAILKRGAQQMLQAAIESEVTDYVGV